MNKIKRRNIWSPFDAEELPWAGQSLKVGKLERIDFWTLGVIGFVFIMLMFNLEHLKPSMSDTWYHVGVAKRFIENGGITAWDWWNYAPTGRPHLYPPLLHLIISTLGSFTHNIILASQLCAATFMPLSLLTIWYAARRILNPQAALLAVLLVLTDMMHFIVMEAHIAGCLINIMLPLLMITFLSRRMWLSILLMTLMLYSHLGFPVCVILGLLLFGVKYRSYLRLAFKVVFISLIFYTPWLSHVLHYLDWLPVLGNKGMPGSIVNKLFSLQSFNLLLLSLGFWGIASAPRSKPECMLPIYMLLGFLPILFTYGGRYTLHTMPLWAILGASVITGLLPVTATKRRIFGIICLTLLPWPTVSFMGGFFPMPLTAMHMLTIQTIKGSAVFDDKEKSEAYRPDCDELTAYLLKNTAPDEIIHTNTVWVADMISLLSDRRTDLGAWWECSKEEEKIVGRDYRDSSPQATFVYIRPEADAGSILGAIPTMPGMDETRILGRFQIGIRKPHKLALQGTKITNWQALSVAGASSKIKPAEQGVHWEFPKKRDKLALITAPVVPGKYAGAKLKLSSSKMSDDIVFGIHTTDGKDYRWPLSLAIANRNYNVRVVFDWMTDESGKTWNGQQISQVYFACPPGENIKLSQPKKDKDKKNQDRALEVMSVEIVAGDHIKK